MRPSLHPPDENRKPDTYLVDEILTMIITQFLSPDDPMKIRLQQFLDDVNVFKLVV